MKKKTKSRSRNDLAVVFWISVLVCLSGAAVNGYLFKNSFFRALTKINEEPIATITFKYKTAQRKFIDRVVWDRLRQNSPVYNGDTIHTSALSEATIWFVDGNVMELYENTMAQVFVNENNMLEAMLEDGEASFDTTEGEKGIKLSTGNLNVEVNAGSNLSAASSKKTENSNEVSLKVLKGNASLSDNVSEGAVHTLTAGEGIAVEVEKTTSMDTETSAIVIAPAPILVPVSPAANYKYLYHTPGETNVHFEWNKNNFENEDSDVLLEIFSDKSYKTKIFEQTVSGANEYDVSLGNGIYYWQLSSDEAKAVAGKIQVLQSFAPEAITPVKNYVYEYRKRKPAVRLIWTESQYSSSYELEISEDTTFENPLIKMRSSQTSAIISTLEEGNYYWRVTPYYTINKIGLSAPSKINSFSIMQKGELVEPGLFIPAKSGIVNTENETVTFSWRLDNEAAAYILYIADNEQLKNPIIKKQVNENYYNVNISKSKIRAGNYYWAVEFIDSEENVSPRSEVRSFYAMKGKLDQHTIEPVDNYKVAQSLMQDLRFTWKKNLPEAFSSSVEIARDQNFSNIVYTENVRSTSLSGVPLGVGTYYWRLVSRDTENEQSLSTLPKRFDVVGNLDGTKITEPGYRAVARENIPYEFKWDPVEGADYYKISIFNSSDESLVYEDNVYGTTTQVEMYKNKNFADKTTYKWKIQAFANAVPGISTRRNGKLNEGEFYLIKLRPVDITRPKKNSVIDGIEAILNPSKAVWSTVDEVSEAQFVLRKVDGKRVQEIMRVPSEASFKAGNKIAPRQILLDTPEGLTAGTYEMLVFAKTLDDIDISTVEEKYIGRFKITPIDPLPAPKRLSVSPKTFNIDYLKNLQNPREIKFEWGSVDNATEYILNITKDNRTVYSEITTETKTILKLLELPVEIREEFNNGNFTWTVEARRKIDSNKDGTLDKVLQSGLEAKDNFVTDIPTAKKTAGSKAKGKYGK